MKDKTKAIGYIAELYKEMIDKQTAGRTEEFREGFKCGLTFAIQQEIKRQEESIIKKKVKEDSNSFTAEDALNIVNTTYSLENHVYKQIKDSAKQGRDGLIVDLWGYGKTITNNLIYKLVSDGYDIKWSNYCLHLNMETPDIFKSKTLEISWSPTRIKFPFIYKQGELNTVKSIEPFRTIPYLE